MAIFSRMKPAGHEQVCHFMDPGTGLHAIIAVHSTALGPGLGGVRIRAYPHEDAALDDVLRLSEAMTYKAACAGLTCGGAKAVVMAPFPADRAAGMQALARAIDSLNGRYVATQDMGMGEPDIALINEITRHAVGRSVVSGGSGNPSPHTADGIIAGMRAALGHAGLSAEFDRRRVAVQGAGSVGLGVIEQLIAAGAEVVAADIDAGARERAADAGATLVDAADILRQPADILSPCAVGGVLDAASIATLDCRVVAGAANNQLATDEDGQRLAERGIVYAPDFVINAGGLINVSDELDPGGYNIERVRFRVASIETTVDTILADARETGRPPAETALRRARDRVASGSG